MEKVVALVHGLLASQWCEWLALWGLLSWVLSEHMQKERVGWEPELELELEHRSDCWLEPELELWLDMC